MESFDELRDFANSLDVSRMVDEQELVAILHAIARVEPPSYEYNSQLITLTSSGGGVSRKPGHILLNWRRFFDLAPDVGVASAGAVGQNGFVRALIGLYVWNKIWRGSEAELSDGEASIIEALWTNGRSNPRFPSDQAFSLTNDLRADRSVPALTRVDFERGIDRLVSMRCIEMENDEVWLREWVRKRT